MLILKEMVIVLLLNKYCFNGVFCINDIVFEDKQFCQRTWHTIFIVLDLATPIVQLTSFLTRLTIALTIRLNAKRTEMFK